MDESLAPSTTGGGRPTAPTHPQHEGASAEKPPRSPSRPVWWALAFSAVSTAALLALAWALLIAHALGYGVAAVMAPEAVAAPDGDRYRVAFAIAAILNLAGAMTLAWLASRTPARTWPPAAQGLAGALFAAVAAACVLLLALGISPVDFLAAL
jgi:hypothetical protein